MSSNLDRIRLIDLAWNERRWADYGDLLADDLVAYASGETNPHHKQDHIVRARGFCDTFPDNQVNTDPYLDLFSSRDGDKTCSVARITGTMTGELKMPGGTILAPTQRCFDVTFTAICTWCDGRIIEQREYFDAELMLAQLGGEQPTTKRGT